MLIRPFHPSFSLPRDYFTCHFPTNYLHLFHARCTSCVMVCKNTEYKALHYVIFPTLPLLLFSLIKYCVHLFLLRKPPSYDISLSKYVCVLGIIHAIYHQFSVHRHYFEYREPIITHIKLESTLEFVIR
jgi:hypothetical protein